MAKNILIIGATSAIAAAVAREYATQGNVLYLIARNEQRLTTMAQDLRVRGAQDVIVDTLDVANFAEHEKALNTAIERLKHIDIVLMAHGVLLDQKTLETNVQQTLHSYNVNALSVIALLTLLANQFEVQKQGTLAVITSVAGDRGRQSNYIYGSAKAMVSVFLQGLRNRLFFSNVNVLDIKPGFVDTPMVAHLKKGPLWAQPEVVAKDIVKAIEKKKSILYTPFFWRYIMFIIKHVPESIFKRGKL
jgi:short-subunit dehydrogenase